MEHMRVLPLKTSLLMWKVLTICAPLNIIAFANRCFDYCMAVHGPGAPLDRSAEKHLYEKWPQIEVCIVLE